MEKKDGEQDRKSRLLTIATPSERGLKYTSLTS